MQDKQAEEPAFKQLRYSERTADRPNESHDTPIPPTTPLFLDQQTPSTRQLNLANREIILRSCYRLNSGILQGTAISQNMRARLRSFLMGQSSKQCLLRETCVLACMLVDLYFAQGGRVEVNEFQSLVIGCLILGCKIKEGKFPTIAFNIFSREQLLAFEKKVARRLTYNLAPPTYHDYAHRTILLWDAFAPELAFGRCPQGVNLRLRKFYEQLDCVFMVLKSLDYNMETLVLNLFYLHTRLARGADLPDPSALTDEKFKNAFYSPNEAKKSYQKFLEGYPSQQSHKLQVQLGLFLRSFLWVQPAVRQWLIRGNEQALQMMRVWDRIQTAPKDNYALAKSVIERINQAAKKK